MPQVRFHRRLQRKQESPRTSRHARSSPHSYPARLRRVHAPEARAASTFSSQALQPVGFSASRKPRACRATRVHRRILTPRVSAGHAPKARTASCENKQRSPNPPPRVRASSPHPYHARLRRTDAPEARATSAFSSQALQPEGFSTSRSSRACRATRVHRRTLTPRISVVCMHPKRSPHRKRVFVAGIAAHRLQRKQESPRTSRHARPSLTPRVSTGHDPKPAPQARFRRRHRSPQASAQAGILVHVAPRAFIAVPLPRTSPQGIHPKPAPQAHFRRKYRSPQASARAGTPAHVAPRAFIAAFSPRASP